MSERSASTFRRATATKAETEMMNLLNREGIHYLWQFPIERVNEVKAVDPASGMAFFKTYVADFRLNYSRILVEVDGDAHNGEEEYDQKRDRYLESQRYRVLRFTNSQVLHHGKDVIATIERELRRKPA